MNRFNLPDINFFEKSPELIEREMLFHIQEKTNLALENADPRRKIVQAMTQFVSQERNNLDYSFKQNLLAYAEDEYLDHKGMDTGTTRLQEKAAVTTIEFVLEESRVSVLTIEAGTLFLVGSDTFFEMKETLVVPVGQHKIQTKVYCTEAGEKGNGYLPGEVSNLVNPLPWVKSVSNISASSGGVEIEENDAYAERIRIAPESFSVAGPEEAYEYWAKTTSQEIADVKVYSPSDATVNIRVLLKDGELPSQEHLDQVLATFTENPIKPLTDRIIVAAPEVVTYDAEVQYWILQSNVYLLNVIQENINKAFQDYLLWQKVKMGRNVDLSELITRLKNAGAHRVAVNSPMFKNIEKYQVANENIATLSFGGLTDE